MHAVETHVLNAFLPTGRKLELGRVHSLERAARLLHALDAHKRQDFIRFEIVELAEEPAPMRVRSLTRAEVAGVAPASAARLSRSARV